jgi:hypothetical protein
MTGVETAHVVVPAIQLLLKGYSYLKKNGLLDRVRDLFKHQRTFPVLLLGASGVGKSQLTKALLGDTTAISSDDRTQTVQRHFGRLQDFPLLLVDTPGTGDRKEPRTQAIIDHGHKPHGIINVVAFGYHEYKIHDTNEAITLNRIRDDFRLDNLRMEIRLCSEWSESIWQNTNWLITVANKADLWYNPDTVHEVIDYYTFGEYATSLRDLDRHFHNVLKISACPKLYYNQVPMSGFYTPSDRSADLQLLAGRLVEYCCNAK